MMKKSLEPYRLLFPVGTVFGALGVIVWVAYVLRPGSMYPAQMHAQLMMGAFLFAFVAGFLMTAIPKMTASFPATLFEIAMAEVFVFGNSLFVFLNLPQYFYLISALSLLALLVFFARRVSKRTKSPPPFFPFVLLGLLAGLIGTAIGAAPLFADVPAELALLGRRLYFEAMILFLVLGVGSRLIPVISGRGVMDEPGRTPLVRNVCLGLALYAAYAAGAYGFGVAGGVLKCAVVSWIAYKNWGLFAKAKTKSRLAYGMRISGAMVVAGIFLAAIQPAFAVHWMHLTYIAGFGLMTLTVASRVTLAHGAYDLAFEAKSPALWICGGLILTAAATRVSAPFLGERYNSHLMYAAIVWVLAVALWGAVFVKRMVRKGKDAPSC